MGESHPPIYDPSSNGAIEVACKTVGGMMRTLKLDIEERIGRKLPVVHPVFAWLAEAGDINQSEMLKTFNSGIGLILSVAADRADAISQLLADQGETVYRLGHVSEGDGVRYTGQLA